MNFLALIRLTLIFLMIMAVTMIFPLCTAFYYGEVQAYSGFLIPMGIFCVLGIAAFLIGKKNKLVIKSRTGFTLVAIMWLAASFLGALPFVISKTIPSFADAFFESVSGFTTTGATILSDVEVLPRSINLWRTQMHWLGGMGIVALTVAILPLLGVGGFKLIKAETTGPEKGKITPKIGVTAKILWFIYLGFTVVQTVLLMFAGMDFIDAIAHTFATLGTGGFSTKNASIGYYNSPLIDWICTVFMILAGVNFSLYYKIIIGKGKEVFINTELKVYLGIIFFSILGCTILLLPQYGSFSESLRYSAFQVASIITTTGFITDDYSLWVPSAQMILFFLFFIGGCSGSTGGSIKVVRWAILWKQIKNEVKKMIHPHGVFAIRMNKQIVQKSVILTVISFFVLYFILLLVTTFIGTLAGADLLTAFSASLALVGNVGPGFAAVGPVENYGFFPDIVKWWYSFAMLAGRLELYTMLIFFFPDFWKK